MRKKNLVSLLVAEMKRLLQRCNLASLELCPIMNLIKQRHHRNPKDLSDLWAIESCFLDCIIKLQCVCHGITSPSFL